MNGRIQVKPRPSRRIPYKHPLTGGSRPKADLHGVIKPVTIAVEHVEHVGHEADLWGGYRHGFAGTTNFALKDYRIDYNLGPASQSQDIELLLSVKGIRK